MSTIDQADRGYGLPVQRERIEGYCRREGLELEGIYEDPGVSGTTALQERPGLTQALRAAEQPGTALVVARFDRLARETLQALLIERDFAEAGVPVLYAEGFNGQGDEAQMMREMLHVMASAERRRLVKRLREGRDAKAAQGGYAGGRPPFGYEARSGSLYPQAEQVEAVRWIFDRVVYDRWTVRRVADALDRERACGRRWHSSEVGRILRREDYKRGTGGLWPDGTRIVDPRVFNRAQAILAERRRR